MSELFEGRERMKYGQTPSHAGPSQQPYVGNGSPDYDYEGRQLIGRVHDVPPEWLEDPPRPVEGRERVEDALRYMSGRVAVGDAVASGLPDGWFIIPRQWGPTHWDATIIAPPGRIGWSLGGKFSKTSADAVRRAREQIREHGVELPEPRPVVTPEEQAPAYGPTEPRWSWVFLVVLAGAVIALGGGLFVAWLVAS